VWRGPTPASESGILDDETIPRLRAQVICGGANNQRREDRHGTALEARGILYVPDYAANAGGIINGAQEISNWELERCAVAIEAIYDTTLKVFALAFSQGVPSSQAADRLAETRLRKS
jgi:glutamate dehydrogenase/leucine dehydrogenase